MSDVLPGPQTADEALARLYAIMRERGYTPISLERAWTLMGNAHRHQVAVLAREAQAAGRAGTDAEPWIAFLRRDGPPPHLWITTPSELRAYLARESEASAC